MYPLELMQLAQFIQFLIVVFIAIFLVYSIVHDFKLTGTFIKRMQGKDCLRPAVIYMQSLCPMDFICFQKYRILNYYRIP